MGSVAGKRAVPSKNEPKCKLCRHERREHIDQLLLARSLREKDPATGANINLEYVLNALRGLGVENPTEENCKTHFRKHVEVVDSSAADAMDEAVEEIYAELIAAAPDQITPVAVAEWQIKAWLAKELARLRNGEGPSITTDQAQAAQKIIQAAKSNEETRQLVAGLGTAIGGAMRALTSGAKQLPEPALEADDADFEEVEVA